jgi:hypothetical protein
MPESRQIGKEATRLWNARRFQEMASFLEGFEPNTQNPTPQGAPFYNVWALVPMPRYPRRLPIAFTAATKLAVGSGMRRQEVLGKRGTRFRHI